VKEIASIVVAAVVLVLFYLVKDRKVRTSKALWIPVLWLFIAGSRPASEWIGSGVASEAERATTYYSGSPIDAAVFETLLVAALMVVIHRRQQVVAILRENRLLTIFFLYALVSVTWSEFPYVALKRYLKAVGDLSMVLIMLTDPNPVAAVRRVLIRTAFWLLPLSYLFIQYYPELGKTFSGSELTESYVGVTTNKNELGVTCTIWGLGVVWCLLETFRKRRSGGPHWVAAAFAFALVSGIDIWLLLTSNSATSLTCFLFGVTILIVTNVNSIAKRPVLVHMVALGALCLALLAIFVAPSLLSAVGRNSTLTGRTDIWHLVLQLGSNPIVGTGYASFWLGSRLAAMWRIYWWHPNEAHDGYLEVYLNLGWIGVAILAGMLIAAYGKIVAAVAGLAEMSRLSLAYMVAALVYNITESAFRELDPIWIALLLAVTAPSVIMSLSRTTSATSTEVQEAQKLEWFEPDCALQFAGPNVAAVPAGEVGRSLATREAALDIS
jgi:O-antigen ligase